MNEDDIGVNEFCDYIYELLPVTGDVDETFVDLPLLDELSSASTFYENFNSQLNESFVEETVQETSLAVETESPSPKNDSVPKIRCPVCAREFRNKLGLSKHVKVHSSLQPKRVFKCEVCEKTFSAASNLKSHTNEIHSGAKKYACELCSYATNNKANFLTHLRAIHTDVNETGDFECEFCGRKFFRKDDLRRHSIRTHGARGFECETCGKSYTSKQYLNAHAAIHKPDFKPEHLCVACGKLFPNASHLRSHTRLRHSDLKFSCGTCGKVLSTKSSLVEHTRSHTGDRPHVCQTCGKAFTTAKYLRIHNRGHTGERPYSCQFCKRSFTQKSSLTVHLRYHTGEKPYRCPVCHKEFVARQLLRTHIKSH